MRTVLQIFIVVGAGVAWPFLCRELFRFGGYVLLPQVELFQSIGVTSSQELKSFTGISDPVIWAVLLGLLFGVPLSALVRRSMIQYWLLLVATVVATNFIWAAQTDFGAVGFLPVLMFPAFWVHLLGVLAVWWLAASLFWRRAKNGFAP
jgi:hypothetical protein